MSWQSGQGANAEAQVDVTLPEPFLPLLEPARYKVFYGGRGSGKSWAMARALLILALNKKLRILCCREYQSSISESVHYILVDQIQQMGLSAWFSWTDNSVRCLATGSEFIFKGIRLHVHEIKSMEAVDICWIEEGQAISRSSWTTLDPTIRKPGSEIWVSYNPLNDDDIVHKQFVLKGEPEYLDGQRYAITRKVNWDQNPFFPPDLDRLRRRQLQDDQDIYAHIWNGETLQHSDAMIFKGKWIVGEDSMQPPEGARLFYGADWGFAQDPTVLVRAWEQDGNLCVDYDPGSTGVEMDEIPALFAGDDVAMIKHGRPPRWQNPNRYPGVPGAAEWPIKADSARPETISYIKGFGFNIEAAQKWKGSVEDGIEHLRSFNKIIIHPRCRSLQEEALMYRYKVDKKTDQVLPIVVDAYNHRWDALRYALDGYIHARGKLGVWQQLASQL